MDANAIYALVSQWYKTGSLAVSDQPAILAAHTEVTGITFSECRQCQWADVQHALMYHLIKELKLPPMDKTPKYLLKKGMDILEIHGLPYVYINKGKYAESASAKHLTDEIAEQLMEKYPDLKEVIVENPDYKAESTSASAAKTGNKASGKTGNDDAEKKLTPQQKSAQTKAAKKAAEEAAQLEQAGKEKQIDPTASPNPQDSQPQS